MGGALALDAAWLFAAFLIVLVLAAAGIAARRFLLERSGATVECGLRRQGGPWRLGVASYRLDEFRWYGIFGVSMRPQQTFPRHDLAVVARRPPTQAEESILGPGRIVAECQLGEPAAAGGQASSAAAGGQASPAAAGGQASSAAAGGQASSAAVDLALAEAALTGLLAWLESAPPGSHLDVTR